MSTSDVITLIRPVKGCDIINADALDKLLNEYDRARDDEIKRILQMFSHTRSG